MSKKLLFTFIAISVVASTLIAANMPAKKEPVYITAGAGQVTIGPDQVAIARFG